MVGLREKFQDNTPTGGSPNKMPRPPGFAVLNVRRRSLVYNSTCEPISTT